MKHLFTLPVICMLTVLPAVKAQDCSNWSNYDLRGTYTMSGSGYIDVSKVFPTLGLPSGMVPMSWVGAHTYDGKGKGTGWVSINAGGNQMTAQMAVTYSMQPNCSLKITFTMTIPELGITAGPFPRLAVVNPTPSGLELNMILGGPAPGTPGAGLDLGASHRISMQYY
jgi:hypothetical protein